MKHRPPPVVGERANHRSLAAVTAAGRSRRRSPATGSRRGSEDAVAPARGWFVRETRLERHSSPRGPRTDGGPQAEMAPAWLYRIGSLCSRRPPPTAAATAAAVVEEPAPQQRREKQERSSRPAHSIRRLLCSRKPTRLIPQRRLAAFSCPSIETDTAAAQGDWRAVRSRRRPVPVPVLHVSEARSVFCNVTKQNVAEKNIHIPRYRFNLRACNSDPQVEQSVGINTTAGGLAHTYRSLLTDTNSRICIGQCQMTFG